MWHYFLNHSLYKSAIIILSWSMQMEKVTNMWLNMQRIDVSYIRLVWFKLILMHEISEEFGKMPLLPLSLTQKWHYLLRQNRGQWCSNPSLEGRIKRAMKQYYQQQRDLDGKTDKPLVWTKRNLLKGIESSLLSFTQFIRQIKYF